MDKIQLLSSQLSNMIAAGEVIERPGSVVKELLENAIDANATRIEISIENAGRTLIEVSDNGEGMSQKDLTQSILRHATSKVKDEYDLFRIKTLGFRGEALPSIASVSRLSITSATAQGPGYQLQVNEGQTKLSASASRQGTTVVVSDLFFNTPARLKFLKNDYIETSHLIDVVARIALGHPHIAFQLIVDGAKVFYTDGRGDMLSVITQIFGKETSRQLVPFQFASHDVTIQGFLGLPSLGKSHRYAMYTLVNGRAVTLPKINQAILEAYKPYLPPVRYPFIILHLHVDPSLVDVNVHPSKKEVRLSKEEPLKVALMPAIQKVLSSHNLAPQYETTNTLQPAPSNGEGMLLKEVAAEVNANLETVSLLFQEEKTKQKLTVVAQMHLTYLVCRDEQGSIYLIDQHAADERIRYEAQLKLLTDKQFAVAPLVPIMVDVKPSEAKLLTKERLASLQAVGLELIPFGANAYKVNSLPSWALNLGQTYVDDLLQQLFEEPHVDADKLRLYALASKACKTSIKAQDALTLEAMQSLVDRLLLCQHPYTCPHGRPTMVQFAKRQLEAMFNRSGF
jgi:DNA mismatch repair protein MutL